MTYDILIIDRKTRRIVFAHARGVTSSPTEFEYGSAEKYLTRLNGLLRDNTAAKVAEAGKFQKGDVLPEEAEETL